MALALCGFVWGDQPRPSALAAPAGSPNVLLISIDTLRADHLSCYGYGRPTSPTIDSLAAEGVLFEHVAGVSSWTLPTHMSLMTGLDPLGHKVQSDPAILSPKIPTLAQRFLEAGYSTAAVVSAVYLNAFHGFSRGFESYDDYFVGDELFGAGSDVETSTATVERATERLNGWSKATPKRPFFLFVHFWDVHHNYQPPPPYDAVFSPTEFPPTSAFESLDQSRNVDDTGLVPTEQIALYDGELRYVDAHIALLLNAIEKLGLANNTIVAVTGDHGEELWQRGDRGHRRTLFEECTHVPLILRYPGHLPAGRRVEQMIRQIDIAPTLLELAGLDPISLVRGAPELPSTDRSVAALARGEVDAMTPAPIAFADLHSGVVQSVRTQTRKFIVDRGKPLYFDLAQDPGETNNLIGQGGKQEQALQQLLTAWVAAGKQSPKAGEAEMQPEQLELLKSLGYIQ